MLSDGDVWSSIGQVRKATEEDVAEWGEEFNICCGEIISVLGDGEEMEVSDEISTLEITNEEYEKLSDGKIPPRKLENYDSRLKTIKFVKENSDSEADSTNLA